MWPSDSMDSSGTTRRSHRRSSGHPRAAICGDSFTNWRNGSRHPPRPREEYVSGLMNQQYLETKSRGQIFALSPFFGPFSSRSPLFTSVRLVRPGPGGPGTGGTGADAERRAAHNAWRTPAMRSREALRFVVDGDGAGLRAGAQAEGVASAPVEKEPGRGAATHLARRRQGQPLKRADGNALRAAGAGFLMYLHPSGEPAATPKSESHGSSPRGVVWGIITPQPPRRRARGRRARGSATIRRAGTPPPSRPESPSTARPPSRRTHRSAGRSRGRSSRRCRS